MTEAGSQIATALSVGGNPKVIDGWEVSVTENGETEIKGQALAKGYFHIVLLLYENSLLLRPAPLSLFLHFQ